MSEPKIEKSSSELPLSELAASSKGSSDKDKMPNKMPQSMRNLIFLVVISVIIGSFILLSRLETPPHNMPPGKTHTLRINSSRKLIGLGVEPDLDEKFGIQIAQVQALRSQKEQLKYQKRGVENRVNLYCARCHGRPGASPKTHPCGSLSGKCLPVTHSPKTECIKCHRQDFSADKKKKTPVNLPLPDARLFKPKTADPLSSAPDAHLQKANLNAPQ